MANHHITDDLELCALERLADAAPPEEHLLVREERRARLGWEGSIRCPAPTTSPAWRPARCLVFRGAFALPVN